MEYIVENIDKITAIFLLVFVSLVIRVILQLCGQRWITTTAHTGTLFLLPLITYVITNVISGNIALSLGMVGALSIVRFRNPVRSPLELAVYFGAITMGIAASVNVKWIIFLLGSIIFVSIFLSTINYFSITLFKKAFFNTSFSEGNLLSTLEVTSSLKIESLDQSKLLTMKRVTQENVQYVLTSKDLNEILKIQNSFNDEDNIISYQINK